MPNENLIDQVVSPVVDEQVTGLTKLLADLDIQMIADIKSANALNSALSNSKSFADYNTNATKTALQLEKIQQAQNKTAETTIKLNQQHQKAADDEKKRADKAIADSQKKQQQSDKEAAAFVASEEKKNQALAKSGRAYTQLVKQRDEARKNASDIGAALGTESQAFKDATENANSYAKKVEAINTPLGNFKDNVGNYARSVSGVFQKAFSGIRTLANIIPNFGIGTFFLLAGEAIVYLVKQLGLFEFELDASAKAANAFGKAFEDTNLKEAVSNVTDLKEQFALAKEGLVDQDIVLKKYNETIGQTIGQTDSLDKAEKLLVANSGNYIKSMFYKAAAAAALAEGTDDLLKATKAVMTAQGNQALNDRDIADLQNIIKTSRDKDEVEQSKYLLRMGMSLKHADDENLKNAQEFQDKLVNQTSMIYDKLMRLANQYKTGFLSKEETDVQSERNKTAFEYNKQLLQMDIDKNSDIIANDKKSYTERHSALKKSLSDQLQIIQISATEELDNASLTKSEQQAILDKSNYEKIKATEDYIKQNRDLNDKQYKQDQEILKNNIQKELDMFKKISQDPEQSYDAKLIALKSYTEKSQQLIKLNYNEQLKDAGQNAESIKIAEQNKAKSLLQLDNETAQDRLKIEKENLTKILEFSKENEQDQLDILQNGQNQALRILTEAKDKKINAISLERAQGKISEQKYNQELLAINDQFAIDRINQELVVQQAILALKEGERDATVSRMKVDGASTEDISKYTSQANKGIQPTKDKIANLGDDLINATSKQTVDNTKSASQDAEARKQAELYIAEQTAKAIDEVENLRQKAFEAEISRLEKLKEQVDKNADNEKKIVNDSIASNATKAREIALIDAQSASQKKAIDAQIAKQKEKAAIADKEAAVAKIILSTAEAAIKAPAELGPILGLAAVPVVIALGAIELAAVLATPIPKFAKGGVTQGGLAIWGEAGMERATLPGGQVKYSNGAELANFPKGTVITPHMELMRQIRPNEVKFIGGEQTGWKEVLAQLKRMEPKQSANRVNVNVDLGFENYKRSYLRR